MTVAVLVTLYIAKHSYDEWARRVVVEHRLKLVTAANSEIRNALTALSAQLYLFGLNKQEYQPIKREVDRITGALNRVVPIRPEKREDWLTKISGL